MSSKNYEGNVEVLYAIAQRALKVEWGNIHTCAVVIIIVMMASPRSKRIKRIRKELHRNYDLAVLDA
ncbi:CLUMA_CG006768, isoform A [Clunio marinus]|uniref:CLUMA_CG006768, isoform A n=1 Tax=Clunio marinus TaxID=568069 RepID=A0A1J1HYP2_9DIPT|nr:CLUMA_CG006768, isoform A [Clunio marinus]